MLALVFNVGDEQLALDHRHVVEIVPSIALQPIAHAPEYLSGMLNYRGAPVPVVDLCRVALSRPSHAQLSSRIIIVRTAAEGLLGLLAEHVVDCRDDRAEGGGGGRPDWRRVEVEDLLPESLREVLWRAS